jgi:two-component system response regulator AtoC
MTGRILIVDDDREMCTMLESGLTRHGFTVKWKTTGEEAFQLLMAEAFDVVLTDLKMSGMGGIELAKRVAENRPDIPVVVVTAFGSLNTAVSALRAGAYDFVSKPIDVDTLALTLDRAVNHRNLLEQINRLSKTVEESQRFDEIIGASAPMKRVYELIDRISDLESSVLVTGESGTGKELVARSLHNRSPRNEGAFIAVNCAAMPETLLESELFGHTSGAFTNAKGAREGLFVQADKGTLFLDEIGDMPVTLQPKILRAIEQRMVRPIGGSKEIPFDVRIIAATNHDLESAVEEGKFREDLFYRLNVIQIDLPPLRARGHDILLLAKRFTEHFTAVTAKKVTGLAGPAAEKLLNYPWPGNVRELRNCIERAVALTRFDKIVVEDLPEKIRGYTSTRMVVETNDPAELATMEEVERQYIEYVLRVTGGNKTHAAQLLGLDRKTLYRKLERYRIEPPVGESE